MQSSTSSIARQKFLLHSSIQSLHQPITSTVGGSINAQCTNSINAQLQNSCVGLVLREERHADAVRAAAAQSEVGNILLECGSDSRVDREPIVRGRSIAVEERVSDILAVQSWWDSEVVGVRLIVIGKIQVPSIAREGNLSGDKGRTLKDGGVWICSVVDSWIQGIEHVVDGIVACGWEY